MARKRILFVVSPWDRAAFDAILPKRKAPFVVTSEYPKSEAEWRAGKIVYVISPASADSTRYQELILRYLERFGDVDSSVIRLNNVRVPAGFGRLCELGDMLIQ